MFVSQVSTISTWNHNYEPQFHWLGLFIPSLSLIVNTWPHRGSRFFSCFASHRKLTCQMILLTAARHMRWSSLLISEPSGCLCYRDAKAMQAARNLMSPSRESQQSVPSACRTTGNSWAPCHWGGKVGQTGVCLFATLAMTKSSGPYTYCWFPLIWELKLNPKSYLQLKIKIKLKSTIKSAVILNNGDHWAA